MWNKNCHSKQAKTLALNKPNSPATAAHAFPSKASAMVHPIVVSTKTKTIGCASAPVIR